MDSVQPAAQPSASQSAVLVVATGLSLSIGWGIRGNFGHEYGAMLPGVLATLAAVLLSGRADWHRRAAYFAFFGALGWSFGGSISYMQVIAYTHSGHSGTQLYGFASLFLIGFLWAAMGGAGAALPALLSRERLTEFFAPLTAVFIAWTLQDVIVGHFFEGNPAFRQEDPLYWYDTDWVAALLAIVAILILGGIRRRIDAASSLILHMAVGWWAGFLILVNLCGLRMTPPRGDNWSGCVGMVLGMLIYFQRNGLPGVALASVISGLIGGFGFASGQLLKLLGVSTGWPTNWHSILEQTYGLINGLGLAVAMLWLARSAPRVSDDPPARKWTGPYAVGFVLLIVTYLNLSKNPEEWVSTKAMPALLVGLSAQAWFAMAYGALGLIFLTLIRAHQRRPLAVLSGSWLGQAQLLYLLFLWIMVIGNFERALVSFAPQRLVTEGVIFLNAVICTALVLIGTPRTATAPPEVEARQVRLAPRAVALAVFVAALTIPADWAVTRAVFGDKVIGNASLHIRFGPNATATKAKPKPGMPHP